MDRKHDSSRDPSNGYRVEPASSRWCNPAQTMLVRLSVAIAALAAIGAASASSAAWPKPLRGVPLVGKTDLRLLVSADPPFVLDVDTGTTTPIQGIDVHDQPVLSVHAVGQDAIAWVDHRTAADSEVYVIRRGTTSATRIATAPGARVAPSADGGAVWLKTYADARDCMLREVALNGTVRRKPSPLPCSVELRDAGGTAVLVDGRAVIDPATRAPVLRTRGDEFLWALAGGYAISGDEAHCSLVLTNLHDGARARLRVRTSISCSSDAPAVRPDGAKVTVAFGNPALGYTGSQALDLWLLTPSTRRLRHLPDMPAIVALKFTSMAWTGDGRLVLLAETERRDIVAVWRPGQKRIHVRRVRIPKRDSGSDAFVVWDG